MTSITGSSRYAIDAKDSIEADFWRELAEIETERNRDARDTCKKQPKCVKPA